MDKPPGKDNVNSLLSLPIAELVSLADKVRREHAGRKLELCGIINAKSGLCGEDCKFCAQSSSYSCDIAAYPLKTKAEIVTAAQNAKSAGAEKFGIVTSGNRLSGEELHVISAAISEIRDKIGIDVCVSLGALGIGELKLLKKAGLKRCHHNIETSPRFYSRIVSTHNFQERVNIIHSAKMAGLEVCSGGIIGMGETWQDRIDMAFLLKELDVNSIPINFLVPMKGTPLEAIEPVTCRDAIKTICLFRIILKDKVVKLAAGRESILKDFQGTAFMAGANGMLIGGYLTVRGRDREADSGLIREIGALWKE